MELPLVSILITSYNREQYIEEAIESALNQSYKNTEIIIVDNCSTDNTIQRLEKYRANSQIRIYVNESNIGQFPNRNKAAGLAKGKYLKYLDSDDQLYSHSLEVMVSAMEKFPESGLGISYEINKNHEPFPFEIKPESALQLHYENGLLFPGPGSIIYKTSVFNEYQGFEDLGLPSDNLLTLKIASDYKIVALPKDLYWWRRHDDQEFNFMAGNPIVQVQYYKINQKIMTIKNNPLNEKQRNYFLLCHKTRLARKLIMYFLRFQFKNGMYLIHESELSFKDLFISFFPVRFFR